MVIRNGVHIYKCQVCKETKESRAYNTKVCPGRCREIYEQRLKRSAEPAPRLLVRLVYNNGLEKFGNIDNDLLKWGQGFFMFTPRQHSLPEQVCLSDLASLVVIRPIKGKT